MMFTNKPEFRVKEVIQLSKLSSEVLNNLLKEANVYLTKRILTYVLAQQISIQIASDRELVQLRGYASELEDYTLLQLLNFTDAQGIEIDTFDIKFRLWTVVFNNLRELSIRDSWIQKALADQEAHFEYTKDVFMKLTRFIDEPNDIDGQPFIIAKESLTRFSSKEEVEALAKSIGVPVPSVLDKEATVNFILRGLEDSNPDLKNELMKKTPKEIEEFAKENYVDTEFKYSKKELVNYILDNYDQLDEHIRNIEYQKHLEIPSLYKYQVDDAAKESFKPNKVFDQELKEMIATIITGETEENEAITEEKSKEELDQVMNEIAQTYTPPKREDDQILLRRIDDLERKLQEKNNYDPNMIALMNKINHMESQFSPNNSSREDMLLKKIEGLENKISRLARGENPDLSEAKLVEQTLLNRISELEEKLSFQKGDEYIQKVTPQSVRVDVPETQSFSVNADDDYEYDMDHFVPKQPVLEGLIPAEELEEPEQSDSEKALLDRLAEIEAKLEEKDSQIESLKEEVAQQQQEYANQESEAVINAKIAQEEAERKLAEQDKELQVLRFLSKKPTADVEGQDEIAEELSESPEVEDVEQEELIEVEAVEVVEESEELDSEEMQFELEEDVEDSIEETEETDESEEIVEEDTASEETLEEIMDDIEKMEMDSEVDDMNVELEEELEEEEPKSEFDKFIEEIHSSKDKNKIKVRRRHTLKPIQVFWKAAAVWVMLAAIGAIILLVYNNL